MDHRRYQLLVNQVFRYREQPHLGEIAARKILSILPHHHRRRLRRIDTGRNIDPVIRFGTRIDLARDGLLFR